MKRTGSRQRARESIARMISKIERLEAVRRSERISIFQRLKSRLGWVLKALSIARPIFRTHQGR